MEIQKATQFIDDISSDDYFAVKSEDWYKNDVVLILTQNEISGIIKNTLNFFILNQAGAKNQPLK